MELGQSMIEEAPRRWTRFASVAGLAAAAAAVVAFRLVLALSPEALEAVGRGIARIMDGESIGWLSGMM